MPIQVRSWGKRKFEPRRPEVGGTPDGGVRLKRTGLRKTAIRRTSGRGKFTPLGKGGGAIEFEILAAVKVAFLVEVVVN